MKLINRMLSLALALLLALGVVPALGEEAEAAIVMEPAEAAVAEADEFELAAPEELPEQDLGAFDAIEAEARAVEAPAAAGSNEFTVEDGVLTDWASDPSVKSLVIPDDLGITVIGAGCFKEETGLQIVLLPDGVKTIKSEAFKRCSGLQQVYLPETLEEIESEAFYECGGLQKLTIPKYVTKIGSHAFTGCKGIQDLTIEGKSLETIGYAAFDECSALRALKLPASVKYVEARAFGDTSSMETLTLGKGVTTIGSNAFCRSGIKKLNVPASVTEIGGEAFEDCPNLETVIIQEGVVRIGEWCFSGCGKLKSASIPGSVKEIENYAFNQCSSLSELTFTGDGLEYIGNSAFYGCASLTEVKLPGTVREIGEFAFYRNSAMVSIDLGNSLTKIRQSAFAECGLKTLKIPGTLSELPINHHFSDCGNLETVVFEDGASIIGELMFSGCTSLKKVIIPNSVTFIGYKAFLDCTSLETITIPRSVTVIADDYSNTFSGCTALTCVYVYEGSAAQEYCEKYNLPYVILEEVDVQKVKLDKKTLALTIGESGRLIGKVLPENAKNTDVLWKSSNSKVATVNNGIVTAVSKGSTTITCIAMGDVTKKATCKVTVTPPSVPVSAVKLNKTKTFSLTAGKKVQLKATLEPENAEGTVVWTSSNRKVATVSKGGKVTGLKKGTVTITATASNGIKAAVRIKVVWPKPTKVSFSSESITVRKGRTVTLSPVLTPANAATTYTWVSSNAKVAKVNSKGRVTGVRKGTAIITVTTANGRKGTIKVNVIK